MHFGSFVKFKLGIFSNMSGNTFQLKQKHQSSGSIKAPRIIVRMVHTKWIKTNLVISISLEKMTLHGKSEELIEQKQRDNPQILLSQPQNYKLLDVGF